MKKIAKKPTKPAVKKQKSIKKTPIKKVKALKTSVSKKTLKKSPTKNKRVLRRKKANKMKRNVLVISFVALASVIIFAIFYQSSFLANFLSNNSGVLNTNTTASGNTYHVSEDELLMFATLAYEDAYRAEQKNGTVQKNMNLPIARCDAKYLANYDGATAELKKKDCLTRDRASSDQRINMFKSQDMVGTVTLDPITGQPDAIVNADFKTDSTNLFGDLTHNIGQAMQKFIAEVVAKVENSEDFYFSRIASVDSAKFLDDWDLVDSFDAASIPTWTKEYGLMTAHTYKRGHDIVIAYRGTDLTDIAEWVINDAKYATRNDSKQDAAAKAYAKSIAEYYNSNMKREYNIYLTGHSLGGYLAQIAGSELLPVDSYATSKNLYNVKRIVYFNGMGMFFTNKSRRQPSNNQLEARNRLVAFNTNPYGEIDDKILLVHMYGDPVSSLGYHYGQVKTVKPTTSEGKPFQGISDNYNGVYVNWIEKMQATLATAMPKLWESLRVKSLSSITNLLKALSTNPFLPINIYPNEISGAVYWFNTRALLSYFMTTHATDYFFYSDFYYQDSIKYYKDNAYDDRVISGVLKKAFVAPAAGSSIASLPANKDTRSFDAKAYGPICSVNVLDPNYSNTTDKISIKKGQYITSEVICNDSSGIDTTRSLTASSINISSGTVFKKVKVTAVSAPIAVKKNGNDVPTSYKWKVTLMGNTSVFAAYGDTYIYLKAGSVVAKDGKTNENTISNSIINLSKTINYKPWYSGNTSSPVVVAEPTDPVVVVAKPVCAIAAPSSITAKFWPWQYAYSRAVIRCSDNLGISDKTITNSDILTNPSGKLVGISVGSCSSASSKPNSCSWEILFRGSYSNLGQTKFVLKSGSVANILGASNILTESNLINVRR